MSVGRQVCISSTASRSCECQIIPFQPQRRHHKSDGVCNSQGATFCRDMYSTQSCVRHRVERFHDLCIHLEHLELEAPPLVWEGLVLQCSNPKGHMACECSADGGFTEIWFPKNIGSEWSTRFVIDYSEKMPNIYIYCFYSFAYIQILDISSFVHIWSNQLCLFD